MEVVRQGDDEQKTNDMKAELARLRVKLRENTTEKTQVS